MVYSSYTQLKIDRSFIKSLDEDESDQAIVKTVITMGKNLGMRIVAEGVENKEQLPYTHQALSLSNRKSAYD